MVGLLLLLVSCKSDSDYLADAAEDAVRAELREPESAQFEAVHTYPSRNIVCGFVNARNGFGGYAGRSPFVYDNGIVTLAGEPNFASAWRPCAELLGLVPH